MTKMEILLKITPAVLIVRKLTLKMEEKRQNRQSLCSAMFLVQKGCPSYSASIYTMDIAYKIDIPL